MPSTSLAFFFFLRQATSLAVCVESNGRRKKEASSRLGGSSLYWAEWT
jgi:hypothetical protein